jgi:hypothetical protein
MNQKSTESGKNEGNVIDKLLVESKDFEARRTNSMLATALSAFILVGLAWTATARLVHSHFNEILAGAGQPPIPLGIGDYIGLIILLVAIIWRICLFVWPSKFGIN